MANLVTTLKWPTPSWSDIQSLWKRGDLVFAIGVILILMILILPLPKWLLDLSLTFSLLFSILILMTSLFIEKPLDFSSFPTILLVSTMMRLSLNVASTRLILGHGHEGTEAAGAVIQAFGQFVTGGNFVIGLIVFSILVIVNFVVITKGSGRIAEVSARFSLDAMPGKQMAVDADLSAGLINEHEARTRRKHLEDEANFFGAMDGAAKFVRGDAIAGLLITLINIFGGVIIGVAQQSMSLLDASRTYTILTIGDGLVTQIPALIVSTAAGMLVSKGGITGTTDKALIEQLSAYPKALGISSALLFAIALLPNMPKIPFLGLSCLAAIAGWQLTQKQSSAQIAATKAAEPEVLPPAEEPMVQTLHIDLIRLELGYGLLKLIEKENGQKLTDQIKALRRQMAKDMGFVLPAVRIHDHIQLPSLEYVIRIKEIEAGRGTLYPDQFLVMDAQGRDLELDGTSTQEPTFGLPALWIQSYLKEEAIQKSYTVVDTYTVLMTHITEVIKQYMAELLSFSETQKLLDDLSTTHAKLVSDLIPGQVSLHTVQRILQNLLGERVSIRDLPTILEGIAEGVGLTRNVILLTEHVRGKLARQLCHAHLNDKGLLPVVMLSPEWEQAFLSSLIGEGEIKQLSLPPSKLQEFMATLRRSLDRYATLGETPVLVTHPVLRPYIHMVIERARPHTVVFSQNDLHPKIKITHLEQI